MQVKEKVIPMDKSLKGYLVKDLDFSITKDELTDSYSIAIKGIHKPGMMMGTKGFDYLTEEEYDTIVKVFKLKDEKEEVEEED